MIELKNNIINTHNCFSTFFIKRLFISNIKFF